MAMARYEDLGTHGKPTPIEALVEIFQREPAQISRAISSALTEGLVTVHIRDNGGRRPSRVPELERRLKDKFERLRLTLVVESPPSQTDQLAYSDEVHRRLGSAMGEEIARGGFIRDGEAIGIGSGRGVYETVRALQRQPPIRARNVSLVSLSGMGYMRHHSVRRNLILDADFIVSFMGQAFEDPVTMSLVASSLIHEKPLRLSPEPWILQDERKRAHLSTALLGVGTFTPGNRFYEESGANLTQHQAVYDPIRAGLRSLRGAEAAMKSEGHHPIADLGYHLFIVPKKKLSEAERQTIDILRRQADVINESILSANTTHFASTNTLTIIAGTDVKAHAIEQLLIDSTLPPVNLCTDERAARIMLRKD